MSTFCQSGPHDPRDSDYQNMVPQRHHAWFRLTEVRRQGRIVEAYWKFNFAQYLATPYGAFMRRLFKKSQWTSRKQAYYSERYVLRMLTLATLWFAVAFGDSPDAQNGWTRNLVLWTVGMVGGFRIWEVFWAQVHYALQTEKSRVTSFARTLLFHVIFIIEAIMNATTFVAFHLRRPAHEILPVFVDVVTLQRSISDNAVLVTWHAKIVAYGALAMSLVILLVAVPLIVGVVAKTWFQNSDTVDDERLSPAIFPLEPIVGERWTVVRGEREIEASNAVVNWRFSRGAVVDPRGDTWRVSSRPVIPVNTLLVFVSIAGVITQPQSAISVTLVVAMVGVTWTAIQMVLLGLGITY